MSSLSERLAAVRRERAAQSATPESTGWEDLEEMGRSPEDDPEEDIQQPDDDGTNEHDTPPVDPVEDGSSDDDPGTPEDQETETERESLTSRVRAAGATALESIGAVARGPLRIAMEKRAAARQQKETAAAEQVAAVERRLDSESLITDDKEILGESPHLRRALRGATRSVMDNLHEARVSTRDVISTPRTKYLENFRDRNALKIQRLEDKISANPDAPEFKRDKEWLAMYKARHDHWNGKLRRQSSKQVSRSETLGVKTEERKENYQLGIDKYIDKKIESVRKKGFRKLQKEQGIGRFDHRAQVQFFKQLSIEERRKITAEAIEAVRYKNIRKGKLERGYTVAADPDEVTRIMSDYERTFK